MGGERADVRTRWAGVDGADASGEWSLAAGPRRADRGGIREVFRRSATSVSSRWETSRAAPETRDATEETSSGGGRTARTGSLGLRGDTLICGSLGRRLGGLLGLGADDEALRAVGAGEERLAGDGLAANVRLDGHLRGRRLGRSLKRHAGEGLGAGSHGRHRVDTSASSSERSSRCGARPARRPSLTRKTKTPNLRG